MTIEATSLDALAEPERHLFVSPHYDDIALSCGGTAALVAKHRKDPVIALLFGSEPDSNQTFTSFAEDMHRKWGMEAREVIAGRRREEAAATEILGASDEFLPFLDAIYRGEQYLCDPQLFGEVGPDDAALPGRIAEALDLGPIADDSTRVYMPLAIGNHVDHQLAFAAGVEIAKAGWNVWFYEDLPYALKPGAREARFEATGVDLEVAAIVDVGDVWRAKIDAILAYPSQLGVIFGYVGKSAIREVIEEVMRTYAEGLGGGTPAERFWKLAIA